MEATELSFSEGDSLEFVQPGIDGWWYMKNLRTGKEGWAPSSYVEEQSMDSGILLEGNVILKKTTINFCIYHNNL